QLAQDFGQATGSHAALRDALGAFGANGMWQRKEPDPMEIECTFDPHTRGSLLVAAVFDAFVSIYKSRIADLLRIATNGTGVLPAGQLHPDLVNRLASEAAKSAQHILNMCIRALDYCPPVDMTFGDYLRALITADSDLVPDDDLGYRVAFIEAFRRRGIYPRDVRTLSVESLRWQAARDEDSRKVFELIESKLREIANKARYFKDRHATYMEMKKLRAELHGLFAETFAQCEQQEIV